MVNSIEYSRWVLLGSRYTSGDRAERTPIEMLAARSYWEEAGKSGVREEDSGCTSSYRRSGRSLRTGGGITNDWEQKQDANSDCCKRGGDEMGLFRHENMATPRLASGGRRCEHVGWQACR